MNDKEKLEAIKEIVDKQTLTGFSENILEKPLIEIALILRS